MTVLLDGPAPTRGFQHETFFYRQQSEFVTGVSAFVREGLAADEVVIVAAPQPRLDLLRDALSDVAGSVQLLDMAEIGANPARIIAVWKAAVERHIGSGRGLRGVGEPAYPGRREAELVECQLHELLLNHAFDTGPAWRLMCPYDERRLPAAVCAGAVAAHPVRFTPSGVLANDAYVTETHREAFAAPLPPPSGVVLRGAYQEGDVPAVRSTVAQFAASCGLPAEKVEDLQLAASELVTNSIRHGGGSGTLAMWLQPDAAVVEFTDRGRITDFLTGRLLPSTAQEGGRGVYLVNQLCDLVQLRSSPQGTTVRITTWR